MTYKLKRESCWVNRKFLLTTIMAFLTMNCELEINHLVRTLISKRKVVIIHKIWTVDKVTILPRVTMSDGVILGVNAVVKNDNPPYCAAGEKPAYLNNI